MVEQMATGVTPSQGPNAAATIPGLTTSVPPSIQTTIAPTATIRLVANREPSAKFWICVGRGGGAVAPSALLDHESTSELLTRIGSSGVSDDLPLMLSDTARQPARSIFVVPWPSSFRAVHELWLPNIVHTVAAWAPQSLGIYVPPVDGASTSSIEVLEQLLGGCVTLLGESEIEVLIAGHDYNAILRSALAVRANIMETTAIRVWVVH